MNRDSIIDGDWGTRAVCIDGKFLNPSRSQEIRNHSPDGFAWGYGGSGPSQLALALLLEATDEDNAAQYYQDFKFNVIASLPQSDFEIKASVVYDWLEKRKAQDEKSIY